MQMTRALYNAMVLIKRHTLYAMTQFHLRTKLGGVGWGHFAIFTIAFWTLFKTALYMVCFALLLAVEIPLAILCGISAIGWLISWPVRFGVRKMVAWRNTIPQGVMSEEDRIARLGR